MFIPLRPRIKLTKFPWLTLLVSVLCVAIYISQERSEKEIYYNAEKFCTPEVARVIEDGQKNYVDSDMQCPGVLTHIYLWHYSTNHLQWHLDKIRKNGGEVQAEELERLYYEFATQAPNLLTARLWMTRGSWNPLSMLTSTLSHGSWDHLIGNLFFFISFSLVVETVLGGLLYLLVYLVMAFGIATIDNLVHIGVESLPTLGLSGIVFGMMVLAATFAPKVKINYFYIVFIFPGVMAFPLWAVASWYVVWNVMDHLYLRDWSHINYVAHLGGALVALVLSITLFRGKRHWADDLILDERAIKDIDERWITKFRQYTAAPVVLYLVFIGYLAVLTLLVWFLSAFSTQLLIAAPIVVALVAYYRSHKESTTPDRTRFRKAMDYLKQNQFRLGVPAITQLAEGGYTPAQIELAKLYERGRGVPKLDNKAGEWYRRAAASGNKAAQYYLGLMMLQGRAVYADKLEPIRWFEKAAKQGLPEAAMSLAHYYARGRGGETDDEKACHWYHRAGSLFLQQRRFEDVDVTIKEIRSIDPGYDQLPGLENEFARMTA
jgi:membrane associated rhomboid family serine protease